MKVLGVIPARGGSVGVKRKNIRSLGDMPLIAHTIQACMESKLLSDFCVSTEDAEIAEIAKSYGAAVPFVRPVELAEDVASELVVQHALQFYEETGKFFDAVMMLQPTSPFRSAKSIDKAISILAKNDQFDSLLTAKNIEAERPEWMFRDKFFLVEPYIASVNGVPRQGLDLVARQDLEPLWKPDGSIFIVKVAAFKSTGKLVTNNCTFFESPGIEKYDIDSELELKIANFLVAQ